MCRKSTSGQSRSKSCRFASRFSRRQLIAGLTGAPLVGGLLLEASEETWLGEL